MAEGMPRFYFDVRDGIDVTDQVGQELSDIDAAHTHALQLVQHYGGSPGMIAEDGGTLVVSIRNDADTVIARHRLVFGVEYLDPAI